MQKNFKALKNLLKTVRDIFQNLQCFCMKQINTFENLKKDAIEKSASIQKMMIFLSL